MCRYFTKNIQQIAGLNPVGFKEKSDRLLAAKTRHVKLMINYDLILFGNCFYAHVRGIQLIKHGLKSYYIIEKSLR